MMAADVVSAAIPTGSILGYGVGAKGAIVRWGQAGRMAIVWIVTLPAAGVMGALCWFVAHGIGGALGVTVVLGALILTASALVYRSRRMPITPVNVNADWEGGLAPSDTPEPAKIAA